MAQLRLEPPAPFDFRKPDDWPQWKRRFEQYFEASSLSEDSAKKQVNTFLYCLREEAEGVVLSSMTITAAEREDYDTVVAKFDAFFQVRRNVIFERARFNRRDQLQGETVEQYIMELYKLMQLDAALTLETAKKMACQRESVGEQNQLLRDPGTSVDEVRPRHNGRRRQRPIDDRRKRTTPTPQTHAVQDVWTLRQRPAFEGEMSRKGCGMSQMPQKRAMRCAAQSGSH